MFKQIYSKILGNSIFNKVFISYTLIIFVFGTILITIISSTISSKLLEQAINNNMQILKSTDMYFESIQNSVSEFMRKLYMNKESYESMRYLFLNNNNTSTLKFIDHNKKIQEFIRINGFSTNETNKYIILADINRDYYIFESRSSFSESYAFKKLNENIEANLDILIDREIGMIPAYEHPEQSTKNHTFSVYRVLADYYNPKDLIGFVSIGFDCNAFIKSYDIYKNNLQGHIIIFTHDGGIIFDSSSKYYKKIYPEFDHIRGTKTSMTITLNNKIINVIKNEEYNIYIAGIISNSELYASATSIKTLIFSTAAICILLALILSYINTTVFSSRIKKIVFTIKQIQKGNFDIRIKNGNSTDELGIISENLNLLCKKMEQYIIREYILDINRKEAEIKQRKAELYALQAQINPHFLYNTLEAIRMNLMISFNEEASQAIRNLADLFRSTIKNDMIVSIEEEINYCKSYLNLINLRFENEIKIEFNVDPQTHRYAMLKHLLQPVIENSIKHGLIEASVQKIIKVDCSMHEDTITISVIDNGSGMDNNQLNDIQKVLNNPGISTDNIGLLNVHQRILLIFGDKHGVTIRSDKGKGTETILKIKAISIKELKNLVQSTNS